MRKIAVVLLGAAALAGVVACMVAATGPVDVDGQAMPGFGITLPPGYRDWKLISVAREAGELDDIRAILGNDAALEAYSTGRAFPDGTLIARLAWSLDASAENNKLFGKEQSFVAGAPKNGLQFMLKDSQRFAATGGWGYAQFDDGQPASEAMLTSCFPCHTAAPGGDQVFTRYAR